MQQFAQDVTAVDNQPVVVTFKIPAPRFNGLVRVVRIHPHDVLEDRDPIPTFAKNILNFFHFFVGQTHLCSVTLALRM